MATKTALATPDPDREAALAALARAIQLLTWRRYGQEKRAS
jgi:hypothetical protein